MSMVSMMQVKHGWTTFPRVSIVADFQKVRLTQHLSRQDAVVKLIKHVYGLKDASKTWLSYIFKSLLNYGFSKSEIDPYLYIEENFWFCLYVDNSVCLTLIKCKAIKLI